jgi:hypothetical protein
MTNFEKYMFILAGAIAVGIVIGTVVELLIH